jgi:hypothetical protein
MGSGVEQVGHRPRSGPCPPYPGCGLGGQSWPPPPRAWHSRRCPCCPHRSPRRRRRRPFARGGSRESWHSPAPPPQAHRADVAHGSPPPLSAAPQIAATGRSEPSTSGCLRPRRRLRLWMRTKWRWKVLMRRWFPFLFENDEEMGSMPCRGVYLKQKNEPCMCAVRTPVHRGPAKSF